MDYQEERENILKTLAKNEALVAQLYDHYALLFPEYANFWNQLSSQEHDHESWILGLSSEMNNRKVLFNRERFNLDVLNSFSKYVGGEIVRSKNKALTILEASSIAYELEKALIEDKFFEVFTGDTPLIKNAFFKIKTSTIKHRELVHNLWLQVGGQS